MKKNFISYIIAGMALVMLQPACKTTDIQPVDRISSEIAFTTPDKINAAVIGVYDGLQSPEFLAGRSLIYSDVLGQDVVVAGASAYFYSIYSNTMISTDQWATNEWNAGFAAVAKANRTMEGIQANLAVAGNDAKAYLAECEFGRALAYFTLVNHFAQPYNFTAGATHAGVPLILKSSSSFTSADLVPRASVADVYKQIIADLKDAEANLPADQGDEAVERANKYAASALLSRVYLYQGDYANAKAEADKVISSGVYGLNANPGDCFALGNYTTKESIFSIANSLSDNPNTNNALPMHYNSSAKGGRADIVVSQTYLSLPGFAADDKRRSLVYAETKGGSTLYYCGKYTDVSGRADWAPIIRYPEMLLTAAEAAVRASGTVDATSLAELNQVRDRSRVSAPQYTAASFATAADFINAVLLERRIELAFEGHRIGDALRNKQGITGKQNFPDYSPAPDVPYGSEKEIFPIPSTDLKLNPNLVQNPGY